jgi:sugar lactone lactonase YvrE
MRRVLFIAAVISCVTSAHAADKPLPKPLVSGLKNPASVAVGVDERIYITVIGEKNKDGDGQVLVVENGKAAPFAAGMDQPHGIVAFQQWLFVVDKNRVWRIDRKGKAEVFAAPNAFPAPPSFLTDITVDEEGTLYVSDVGELKSLNGAIYRISPKGKVNVATDAERTPALKAPTGLVMDGMSHVLVVDAASGDLLRVKLADGKSTKLAGGFAYGAYPAWD